MVDRTEPTFDAVEQALREADLLGETAEIHGELCARLCLLGEDAGLPWVAGVIGEVTAPETAILLEALAARTSVALDSGDMSFALLLPSDEAPLEARAEALGLWCQGFLHGLGATGDADQNPLLKGGTISEIIDDFSQITRASFAEEETATEGEAGYAELVEYVRVSGQLVYEEMRVCRTPPAGSGAH